MARIDQHEAHDYLNNCGIFRESDGRWPNFYVLTPSKVDRILEVAAEHKYRKPKAANGSRGRYFYEYLRRTAK